MIEDYDAILGPLDAGIRAAFEYGSSDKVFFGTARKEPALDGKRITFVQLQRVSRSQRGMRNVQNDYEFVIEARWPKNVCPQESEQERFKVLMASRLIQELAPYDIAAIPTSTSRLAGVVMDPRISWFEATPQDSADNFVGFQMAFTCFRHVLQ